MINNWNIYPVDNSNFDKCKKAGIYSSSNWQGNINYAILITFTSGDSYIGQLLFNMVENTVNTRVSIDNGLNWKDWVRL